MTNGYCALLDRLRQPLVENVDRVRQRLTGAVGVNPGDRMCFTTELIQKIIDDTQTPPHHTMTVLLADVRVRRDGAKVLVLELSSGRKGATCLPPAVMSSMDIIGAIGA